MLRVELYGRERKAYRAVRKAREADPAGSMLLNLQASWEAARIAARVAREARADEPAT